MKVTTPKMLFQKHNKMQYFDDMTIKISNNHRSFADFIQTFGLLI